MTKWQASARRLKEVLDNELRCRKCGRLLLKGLAVLVEVKCPRCKTYNYFVTPRQN